MGRDKESDDLLIAQSTLPHHGFTATTFPPLDT